MTKLLKCIVNLMLCSLNLIYAFVFTAEYEIEARSSTEVNTPLALLPITTPSASLKLDASHPLHMNVSTSLPGKCECGRYSYILTIMME